MLISPAAQRLLFALPILFSLAVLIRFAQNPDFDHLVEPLTAIDQQFMTDQRIRVEQLANRLGRNLSGVADRDVETLQRISTSGWWRPRHPDAAGHGRRIR